MAPTDVCHASWMVAFAPLLGPLIWLAVLGMQRLAPKGTRRTTPPGPRATVAVAVVCCLGGVVVRAQYGDVFYSYSVSGDTLTLGYLWPTSPAVLPAASISSLGVVRGRAWDKHGGGTDRWWLRVVAGGQVYPSCKTGIDRELIAAGKAIGAALLRPVEWMARCPTGETPVVTTEEVVASPERSLRVPAACASGMSGSQTAP